MKNPYAAFWAAHADGKIKDINLSTCMDPKARFNYGVRAHHGVVMARNYKDKKAAVEIKLAEPTCAECEIAINETSRMVKR